MTITERKPSHTCHMHIIVHVFTQIFILIHTLLYYTYQTTPLTCFTLIPPRTTPTRNTWHACGTILWSITSIGALLDSNLLVRSACRSIGSHISWLIHCSMGLSWFFYMFFDFFMWIKLCILYPWSLIFYFYPQVFLKFICCPPTLFWNSII